MMSAIAGKRDVLAAIAVIAVVLLASYLPLAASIGSEDKRFYLSFLSDDFFYYLQIARNVCRYGLSTFDMLTLTNGYHPLWMLVVSAVTCITGKNELLTVTAVLTIKALASFITYRLFYRIAGFFLEEWSKRLLVTLIPFFIFLRLTYDMEVLLTVPLLAYFILFTLQHRQELENGRLVFFKLGLIASFLVLSRLDTAIFVLLFWTYVSFALKWDHRTILRGVLFFAVGGMPVPLYLLSNIVFFETLLPFSGMAKQLKTAFSFTPPAFADILSMEFQKIEMTAFVMILAAPLLFLIPSLRKVKTASFLLVVILFPTVYYLVLAFVSDWPIWRWYLYPVPSALLSVSILVLSTKYFNKALLNGALVLTSIFIMAYSVRPYLKMAFDKEGIYAAARYAAAFAEKNPGTYAMGDRAGKVGYLLGHPLVQLEGLVADRQMVEFIRREADLHDVFSHYGIDYYIATSLQKRDGCYAVTEPVMAGELSHAMHGVLCYEPAAIYKEEDTYIFDIKR